MGMLLHRHFEEQANPAPEVKKAEVKEEPKKVGPKKSKK